MRRTLESQFQEYRDHGSARALARVFDASARDLLAVARHLAPTSVDAEDLVQATYVTAMEKARDYDAKRRVQEGLLLEAVAKSAELEASEEEIDARLDEMATGQGVDAKLMHDMANAQGWRPAIAAEVVDKKALDHLADAANVTEVDPPSAD